MLFRLGDLEDLLNIEDNADRQSDLTWKITAVVLEDLQDLKATKMELEHTRVYTVMMLFLPSG